MKIITTKKVLNFLEQNGSITLQSSISKILVSKNESGYFFSKGEKFIWSKSKIITELKIHIDVDG